MCGRISRVTRRPEPAANSPGRHVGWLGVLLVFACPTYAEAVSPRRLLELIDFGRPVVSPDGRNVAFRTEQASVERNTWDTVWYVQSFGMDTPRRVADGGVPLRDSAGGALSAVASWSSDGRWIYYRAKVDGAIDVWRAAVDGSGAEPVTRDPADVRAFELAPDGRRLRYSVGPARREVLAAEEAEYADGIRIDARVPVGQGLFRSGNLEDRLATQRFGDVWFDRALLLGDVPDRWTEIDLDSGERRRVDGPWPTARRSPGSEEIAAGEDAWLSAVQPGTGRVARLTRAGDRGAQAERPGVRLSVDTAGRSGNRIVCDSPLCTGVAISGLQWRADRDEILFTVTDPQQGLAQSIRRWRPATGEVLPVATATGLLSGGRAASSACGVSADMLVCVAADANGPPRLESIAIESGARREMFSPNASLATDLGRATYARLMRWPGASGRAFTGRLHLPVGVPAERLPLFVTYYTCPGFIRGGVGDEWPLASFAESGIAALCINQLPGYTVDAVARHDEALEAVRAVVDLLSAEGVVDPRRVGMGGLSYGGAATMWTATESDLLAAGSIANPVVSPLYHLLGSLKGEVFEQGLNRMWGLRAPEETPERWRALSPVFKLDRLRAPLLFQHSEQEYLYALDYLVPLLREQRAELYVFPHEPHQKFQPRHKLAVYQRNLDWFRFWLQGYEDPAPTKTAQYARWRAMRDRQVDAMP